MSSSTDWAALASHNERLMQAAEALQPPGDVGAVGALQARWAELASQRERLVNGCDPLSGLASSARGHTAPRLVVSAA